MAKKTRVRMHCLVCHKNTPHEVRIVDGQESAVCLTCAGTQKAAENAALAYENKQKEDRFAAGRVIEEERARTFSPGG